MLKLQHAQERDHAYRAFAPIEWSEDLRCWCVFDPELIVAILKSPQFPVPDYVGGYAKLDQKRAGQGWNVFADMLWNIPFANEGDRHAALRRDFARLIGTRSPAAKKAVARCWGNLFRWFFATAQGRT